jgi:hypothetical protein
VESIVIQKQSWNISENSKVRIISIKTGDVGLTN